MYSITPRASVYSARWAGTWVIHNLTRSSATAAACTGPAANFFSTFVKPSTGTTTFISEQSQDQDQRRLLSKQTKDDDDSNASNAAADTSTNTIDKPSPHPASEVHPYSRRRTHFLDPSVLSKALQSPAGSLYGNGFTVDDGDMLCERNTDEGATKLIHPDNSDIFIPHVPINDFERQRRKRVLVLCTGGTLTMAPDPGRGGALAPVEGAVTAYMKEMRELNDTNMPEVVCHEYTPFYDSSDLGPPDWAVLANDIKANYLHFDGFVVLMGTDTMAYCSTALSFVLENLGKPVVFTGSQIPFCEPYNDARRNLIMALIFASRDTINEVSIFFHDRLLRACRSTKVNTHRLLAFDSPNLDPLAKIGITIDENEHLILPPPRGALRVHSRMDTRLLTVRLVPGFDDGMIKALIKAGAESKSLKTLVLQLYGTGNVPSVKDDFIHILGDAKDAGILVVAATQCFTGSVMMGHYATGLALASAGVVSANDMTVEAIACKCSYLFGRGDLTNEEVGNLLNVSIRGEVTPVDALSPPPLSSAYQRASRKGRKYY